MRPRRIVYILCFSLPVLCMLGIFIGRGIFPFGNNSFMFSDMYHQYVPFLTEFWRKLREGESLTYSFRAGLGSNFVAMYAYYLACPVNWLVYFLPEQYLIEFMTYLIVIKIGLCGVSFSYFLCHKYCITKKEYGIGQYVPVIGCSVLYAMCGFIAAYNWDHMWLDSVWLTPFIILGLERLVKEGKGLFYTLFLTLCIFMNYYMSIIVCIFLVLYFVMLFWGSGLTWRNKGRALCSFAWHSLLAGGLSGILLLPVMWAMHVSDFVQVSFPKVSEFYFNTLEVIARHSVMFPAERGLDHWPNIYSGVLVFILIPLYFFNKKIYWKEKIGKAFLIVIFFMAFSNNILNFIWHGMNYPDSLPARQSFLYSFLLLTMCFEAVWQLKAQKWWQILCAGLVAVILLTTCGIFVYSEGYTVYVAAGTWAFLLGYVLILLGVELLKRKRGASPKFKRHCQLYGSTLLVILIVAESVTNMAMTSVQPVQRYYYMNQKACYEELLEKTSKEDQGFYRYDSVDQMTKNDSMLVGYPSASIFSSTINGSIEDFYDDLGMGGSKVSYYYNGATPFASALLGVKYTFSEELLSDKILYELIGQARHGDITKYLYQNRYTLPIGFVLSEDIVIDLEDEMEDNDSNPIQTQNDLVSQLVEDGTLFQSISKESDDVSDYQIVIHTIEDGHLYGALQQSIDETLYVTVGEETKEFTKANKSCIIDLGWYEAEAEVTLSTIDPETEAETETESETDQETDPEPLRIRLYRMSTEVLEEALGVLGQEPLQITVYGADHLEGYVNLKEAGQLVLSIPYEPGWSITVDGQPAVFEKFADTMICVHLQPGEHQITMKYYLGGVKEGAIVSGAAVLLLLMEILVIRARKKKSGLL